MSDSKTLTPAERKQEYRRWEKGAPLRRRRFLQLVKYAQKIRDISAKYLPQNQETANGK